MKVLLVEDDTELAKILEQGFAEHEIRVTRASTFELGLQRAREGSHDVIVLDVLLPGGDGFRLCGAVRDAGVITPIVMLTALDAVTDRVRGLEVGADDYVVKPFEFRELLARVRAVARRPASFIQNHFTIADLEIDFASHKVRRGRKQIELTVKEFALLEMLARNMDRVMDRVAITSHVWDENHDPFTNVLEVLVSRLRRKIDDPFPTKLIHTRRGAGYRFGL